MSIKDKGLESKEGDSNKSDGSKGRRRQRYGRHPSRRDECVVPFRSFQVVRASSRKTGEIPPVKGTSAS